MSGHISLGIALVLIGGFLNGSFAFPMKRLPAWRWENIWLAYSFSGMIFVPWITAAATVPHLAELYRQSSSLTLVKVTLFGLGWGVGSTLFGMGISRVGLALGFAVTLGITASFGSVLPLAVLHPEELLTHRGLALIWSWGKSFFRSPDGGESAKPARQLRVPRLPVLRWAS